MNKEVIRVGEELYQFPRLHYETDASYFLRKEFFINASPKTEKEYYDAINMSIVWSSIQILGCQYPPEVMEQLNRLS